MTKVVGRKFLDIAKLYKQNHNFEVRALEDIHDRHLIVDDRAWLIGQSLKAAGKNAPLSIVELHDVKSIRKLANDLWSRARRVT